MEVQLIKDAAYPDFRHVPDGLPRPHWLTEPSEGRTTGGQKLTLRVTSALDDVTLRESILTEESQKRPGLPAGKAPAPLIEGKPSTRVLPTVTAARRNWRFRLENVRAMFQRQGRWNIGIVSKPIESFLEPAARVEVSWFDTREGGYMADPFAFRIKGRNHIMFERFDYSANRGVICVSEFKEDALRGPPKVALDLKVHASYPFVFEHEGTAYCVPETAQAGEVCLYRSEESTDRWVRVTSILGNLPGLDSSLFEHKGRWWLACTSAVDGANSKLLLFYASRPNGPWTPHARNPVKVDIHSARPAGTPFVHRGSLYRPAQDCSVLYGARIVLNRVVDLSPTGFTEIPESVIEPHPRSSYPSGVHTLSAMGRLTLVDGRRFGFPKSTVSQGFSSTLAKLRVAVNH